MESFWSVVTEMTGLQRRQLLGFCWGRSRLPSNPTQPFIIDSQGGADDNKLPQSHTCMFQLHLPKYSSKAILKQRLLCAIQEGGSRSDRGSKHQPKDNLSGDTFVVPTAKARSMPPTVAIDVPPDGGHLEDLRAFCARAGVGIGSLTEALGVSNDM